MLHTQERPMKYDRVLGQDFVVENLRKQSLANKFSPLYIFEGNKGSGKTTIARIVAKAANCENKDERGNPCCTCASCKSIQNGTALDYIEIDGASNNGVNEARAVIENANYVPAVQKKKVIVIDEAHMLSNAAFNAFLKTFEEPPEYCIFIMATTECHKIPETVRSRALKYTFNRIDSTVIMEHVKEVAAKYQVTIEADAAALIAKKARGAMRDALGELEKCLLVGDTITAKDVMYTCGIEDSDTLLSMFGALCDYQKNIVFEQIEAMYKKGRDMNYVLEEILDIVTDALKYKGSNDTQCILNTKEYIDTIVEICKKTANERLSFLADSLMELKKDLRIDASKSNVLISMSKMCDTETNIAALLDRIKALELAVSTGTLENITVPAEKTATANANNEVNSENVSKENKETTSPQEVSVSNIKEQQEKPLEKPTAQKEQAEQASVNEKKVAPADVTSESKTAAKWTSTASNLGKSASAKTSSNSSDGKEVKQDVEGVSMGEDGFFHFDKTPTAPKETTKPAPVSVTEEKQVSEEESPHSILGIPGGFTVPKETTKQEGISNNLFSMLGVSGVNGATNTAAEEKTAPQEVPSSDGFASALPEDVPFEQEQAAEEKEETAYSEEQKCDEPYETFTLGSLLVDPLITTAVNTCCEVCVENDMTTIYSRYGVIVNIVNNYIAMNMLHGVVAKQR